MLPRFSERRSDEESPLHGNNFHWSGSPGATETQAVQASGTRTAIEVTVTLKVTVTSIEYPWCSTVEHLRLCQAAFNR